MNILATLNRGAPPIGLGMFMRASFVDGPWSWVAILGSASNYAHEAGAARAAGKQVWLYAMPASFKPDTWRDGLAMLLARAQEVGAEGIIVDPETDWPNMPSPARVDQAQAFGAALRDAAEVTRVGITSYPAFGPLFQIASAAGDACFGVPQLYGQPGAFTQSEIDAQWSRWRQAFGMRLIPAFAAWQPTDHPELGDAGVYAAYLDRLPRAGGAIGWTAGPIPVNQMNAIARWSPGGNVAFTLALGALSWAGRPTGAVAIGLGVAVLVMLILFTRQVTSRA